MSGEDSVKSMIVETPSVEASSQGVPDLPGAKPSGSPEIPGERLKPVVGEHVGGEPLRLPGPLGVAEDKAGEKRVDDE